MSTATPSLAKLPTLTGLRFFAALSVFFFHITLSNSPIPPNNPINPFADAQLGGALETIFSKAGYLGVSFFFILSGFVIAWSYKDGEKNTAFWRRRLVKIFPNHIVMWIVAMVLFAAAITSPAGYLSNLFLLNSFVPDGSIYVAVNPPSWTLCSELLFYMLFPLLYVLVKKIKVQRLWLWAGLMVVGILAVALITQFVISDSPKSALTPISTLQFWFGYIFPVPRLFEFVLGSILARLVMQGVRVRLNLPVTLLLCLGGYLLAYWVPFTFSFTAAMVVPLALLIVVAAGRDADGKLGVLASKPMQFLGNISFGFYLCQGVTIFYARIAMGNGTYPTWLAILTIIGLFLLTLLGGWLLYTFVEMPAMRRWARPRSIAKPTPAPVRQLQEEVS
ncbi:acyltransferase family protein [Psychromicrobium sp. YIM B11713]|uniref:acyltransferase family protein n=1 Tax=Psychromicrobium sp. YIM B11713 TaxID=3145233 RepID=UPI00374E3948